MSKSRRPLSGSRQIAPDAYVYGRVRRSMGQRGDVECPVRKTHLRMQDCHDQWHAMMSAYRHPDHFRRELNTLIQSLRNVTFILQSEKSGIPDFDDWYGPWRTRMGDIPVMRWVIASRNRVVKQGDLDTRSLATARVVTSYWAADPPEGWVAAMGEGGTGEFESRRSFPPSTPDTRQVKKFLGSATEIPPIGYIELARRWVDSALPERELGDACAEAFGVLSQLIDDLHSRLGLETHTGMAHGGEDYIELQPLSSGRLPCMATTDTVVLRTRISDGSLVVAGRRFSAALQDGPDIAKHFKKSQARYGITAEPPIGDNVTAVADWCMASARTILQKDGWHGWYLLLYRGQRQVDTLLIKPADKTETILAMKELAKTIERSDIDGIVSVSDTWIGTAAFDESGKFIPPAYQRQRREALLVVAEDAFGNSRQLQSLYRRVGGRIEFEEEMPDVTSSFANFLEPVREAWRRMGLKGKDAPEGM